MQNVKYGNLINETAVTLRGNNNADFSSRRCRRESTLIFGVSIFFLLSFCILNLIFERTISDNLEF